MLYIHPEATRNCKQHCERNCVQSEKSPKLVSKRNWPGMREAAPVLFPSSVFFCSFRFPGFSPAQRTSMIVVHLLLAATRRATDAQNNFLDLNADGSKSEISNYEIAQKGKGNCTWLISIFLSFPFTRQAPSPDKNNKNLQRWHLHYYEDMQSWLSRPIAFPCGLESQSWLSRPSASPSAKTPALNFLVSSLALPLHPHPHADTLPQKQACNLQVRN